VRRPTHPHDGVWDLGSKLTPQVRETAQFGRFGVGAQRIYANDIVLRRESGELKNAAALHVGSMVTYKNTEGATSSKRELAP
jgi:hypothetical protein